MKGILCRTAARTNEEYRIVVKNRIKLMIGLMVIGIITFTVSYIAHKYFKTSINEHMLGVYSGAGFGLFASGLVSTILNVRLLKNEDKLKESRLANSDERIEQIENKAWRVASLIMFVTIYGIGLIGGLINNVLVWVLFVVVFIFIISYAIAYQVYSRRM